MSIEKNKEQIQASQQGSGSAENKGQGRQDQQQNSSLNEGQRENIGNQLGNDKGRLSSLDELGSLSGRDDAAGGSGDRMEDQSTGQETDR